MTPLAFPILQVSGDSIMSFQDERAFFTMLCLATDKAIKAGFFREARLIDANLVEHQIQRLELVGRSSLFDWLRRGREIKALEISSGSPISFDRVKASIGDIIKSSSFWSENEDAGLLLNQVQAADDFSVLVKLFG